MKTWEQLASNKIFGVDFCVVIKLESFKTSEWHQYNVVPQAEADVYWLLGTKRWYLLLERRRWRGVHSGQGFVSGRQHGSTWMYKVTMQSIVHRTSPWERWPCVDCWPLLTRTLDNSWTLSAASARRHHVFVWQALPSFTRTPPIHPIDKQTDQNIVRSGNHWTGNHNRYITIAEISTRSSVETISSVFFDG